MTAAYPLGLPTVLRSKRRRSPAAFGMHGARRGTGYVTALGTVPPQFWDVTFRFTQTEAAAFMGWFTGTINRGADEFTMPLLTEFGTLTHTLRFLPDSLLPVQEEGEVWVYTATLMSRVQVVPEGAPDSSGLTTAYPLGLPTILRATKRRRQGATFGLSDPETGYAYAEQSGPDVPVVWDIALRMTRDQAALLQVWFIDVLERGVKTFTMPIKTEVGLVEHDCQFMPAGLLQTSEDGEVVTYTATIAARNLKLSIFSMALADLRRNLRPMSSTPQTPRWEPDTDGNQWFVRPLATMATSEATGDRFTALDTAAADYDAGDSGTWTTFFNHPLSADRDTNPIDPESVAAIGYPNKTWTGTATPMETEVKLDTTTSPGERLYYIRSSRGPGFIDPVDSQFKGTATVTWRYADLSVLDGSTYAKAWPGLDAIPDGVIQPGDTLWVCGTHEGQTLPVSFTGAAGAYVKIRTDYPTDPGRINKARVINRTWTASGDEYHTDYADISEAMMFEDGQRLIGINSRSRCRTQVQHSSINYASDTFVFNNIRRIQTGDPIDIPSDFQWEETLPLELEGATRYYAIVTACTGWVGGVPGTWQYYSVATWQYTVKLAASYADAIAGTAIDLTALRSGTPPQAFFLIYVTQDDYPFYDPQPGALEAGQYAVDIAAGRLHYRPTTGTPDDHELRLAAETYAEAGACIYGSGVSYIKILGGGEWGGLFANAALNPAPAPVGRIGLSHMNAIEFQGGQHIVIDGLHIEGTRSSVAFVGTAFGTTRNCRIAHCAHHGSGGEDLAGTQEPDQLQERNWFSDIGQGHDFGDAQALVTNPSCHRTVFRRNFGERIGRNNKVSNPATVVYDSSTDVVTYLNWMDNCHGKMVEMDGGNGEPGIQAGYVVANICTRQGQGLDPAENLVQREGFININLNGPTDKGVAGIQVFGNLVAFAKVGDRAPDTLDDCGMIYQRTNNNDGTYDGSTPSANEIEVCTRNVFMFIDGPVFAQQKNTNASAAPWPTLNSDGNVYISTPEFAIKTSSGTPIDAWSDLEVQGVSSGYWEADTGNDGASRVMRFSSISGRGSPTVAELEILRLYAEFDTYDVPTQALIGNFPTALG